MLLRLVSHEWAVSFDYKISLARRAIAPDFLLPDVNIY